MLVCIKENLARRRNERKTYSLIDGRFFQVARKKPNNFFILWEVIFVSQLQNKMTSILCDAILLSSYLLFSVLCVFLF